MAAPPLGTAPVDAIFGVLIVSLGALAVVLMGQGFGAGVRGGGGRNGSGKKRDEGFVLPSDPEGETDANRSSTEDSKGKNKRT